MSEQTEHTYVEEGLDPQPGRKIATVTAPGGQLVPPPAALPAIPENCGVDQLLAVAVQSGATVDQLDRLMGMRRELKAEAAREAYFAALSSFQAEVPEIPKSKKVYQKNSQKVRYSYAPLEVIVSAVSSKMQEHGFSYMMEVATEAGNPVGVTCVAHHKAGHSETTSFPVTVDPEAYMNAMQKVASAVTYSKRYAFCNAFGILTADEDDDANGSADGPESGPGRAGKPRAEPRGGGPMTAGVHVVGIASVDVTDKGDYKIYRATTSEGWSSSTTIPAVGVNLKLFQDSGEVCKVTLVAKGNFLNIVGAEALTDEKPAAEDPRIDMGEKIKAIKQSFEPIGITLDDLEKAVEAEVVDWGVDEVKEIRRIFDGLNSGMIQRADRFPWLVVA